jgi:ABC-type transporter Mla subunit MlaD
MKTRHLPQTLIATTVVIVGIVLLGAMTIAITGARFSPPDRVLHVDFKDATGVHRGTAIQYAGAQVGRAIAVRHLTREERSASDDPAYLVRVTVEIDDTAPPIPADVEASLGSESLLGEKFIALKGGSVEAAEIANEGVLAADATDLMQVIADIGVKADSLLEKLNHDFAALSPKLTDTITLVNGRLLEGSNLVARLNHAAGNLRELTDDVKSDYSDSYAPKIETLLTKVEEVGSQAENALKSLSVDVENTLGAATGMLDGNRENIDKVIAELKVISQNLKVASTYAKAFTSRIGEKPSRLIWDRKVRELADEEEILASEEPVPIKDKDRNDD